MAPLKSTSHRCDCRALQCNLLGWVKIKKWVEKSLMGHYKVEGGSGFWSILAVTYPGLRGERWGSVLDLLTLGIQRRPRPQLSQTAPSGSSSLAWKFTVLNKLAAFQPISSGRRRRTVDCSRKVKDWEWPLRPGCFFDRSLPIAEKVQIFLWLLFVCWDYLLLISILYIH